MGDLTKVGKVVAKSLIYFEVVTTSASLIGLAVSYLLASGDGVATSASAGADVSKVTQSAEEGFGLLDFLKSNFTIQVLLF